jgi:hypothetical protein
MSTHVSVLQVLRRPVLLALAPALLLAGCTQLKVKMGMRMNVATLPVNSMNVELAKTEGVAPGQKASLVVTFAAPGGKTWKTEGAGGGPIMWQDLTVTPTIVAYSNDGTVRLPVDPRLSDGRAGHVVVTLAGHADLRAETDIPVRYDQKYYADFSGSNGPSGTSGQNGLDGSRGSDGSFDPQHPTAGGNGGDGGNGSDGQDGWAGGDARDVLIRLVSHPGDGKLIEASVQPEGGKETFYLIDPNGGSLSVSADGGRGGTGGKGGSAGRGGSGGSGSPMGMSGHDGLSGRNGSDGQSGRAGKITVIYNPDVAANLKVLHLSNFGGPKPVFTSVNLDPLW